MSKGSTVHFNPAAFASDGGLLDLSLSDVVSLVLDKEKHRFKDAKDDENQAEDFMSCRVVPTGLLMTLDGNARRLGLTRSMLTRCVSHQVIAWLDSQPRIREISDLFNVACDAAEEFGYPDLYDEMTSGYVFSSAVPRQVSFRTIRWVKNKIHTLSQPLGIPAGYLFAIGLCYSLTRAGIISRGTINKYLSNEVNKFVRYVDERSVKVCGFNDLVRRRAKNDGLDGVDTKSDIK